jgi:hypothetical protein
MAAGDIGETLEKETRKWLEKLESEVSGIIITGRVQDIDSSVENIHAYMSDCRHFLDREDLVNAFEAVIYAWGIYETLLRIGAVTTGKEHPAGGFPGGRKT